jgi:predicted Fe-S protein YdhL (DUF1289 family)
MSDVKKTGTSVRPAERPINSPCVSICVLNEEDICTGCYRTGNEISHWGVFDNDERMEVLKRCAKRAKASNPFMN